MKLSTYISDLLYRYECVIVPNFGGFVSHKTTTTINEETHTFTPPVKKISFNKHLQQDDGLLANYIVSCKKITYKEALQFINSKVSNWRNILQTEELELSKLGVLQLTKAGFIVFEPTNKVNYLTSSFGLASFSSPVIERTKPSVIPIQRAENHKKTPAFVKYVATAAILLALSTVGWNKYKEYQNTKYTSKIQLQQKQIEQKIQEATFVISNPLPSITLNVNKQTHKYHIIAGAFREPKNAEKKLKQLIEKGFDAKILGVNKWSLTQVSYGSFNSKRQAINTLNKIKRTYSKDAWLLNQEL